MQLDYIVFWKMSPGVLTIHRPVICKKGEPGRGYGTVAAYCAGNDSSAKRPPESTDYVPGRVITRDSGVVTSFIDHEHARVLSDPSQALVQPVGRAGSSAGAIVRVDMDDFHGFRASKYIESGL